MEHSVDNRAVFLKKKSDYINMSTFFSRASIQQQQTTQRVQDAQYFKVNSAQVDLQKSNDIVNSNPSTASASLQNTSKDLFITSSKDKDVSPSSSSLGLYSKNTNSSDLTSILPSPKSVVSLNSVETTSSPAEKSLYSSSIRQYLQSFDTQPSFFNKTV